MFKKIARLPTFLVTQAAFAWEERRTKVYIPYLKAKIQQLRERIREKRVPAGSPCPSEA